MRDTARINGFIIYNEELTILKPYTFSHCEELSTLMSQKKPRTTNGDMNYAAYSCSCRYYLWINISLHFRIVIVHCNIDANIISHFLYFCQTIRLNKTKINNNLFSGSTAFIHSSESMSRQQYILR